MKAGKRAEPTPEITFCPDGPRDAALEERLLQDKDLPRYLDAAIESRRRGDPPVTLNDLRKRLHAR
ncbi:MAG: hypothetical protein OXG38_04415 [Chloroflexi bacterium]|nr:hypothetical protein [Chloroflexota bacterium]